MNDSGDGPRLLFDTRFRAELHHLLWIEPFKNRGVFDAGWSCRDHAFLVCCVLRASGFPTMFVHGKNMYVQGAEGTLPPVGVGQKVDDVSAHTWLQSSSRNVIDVSPRLRNAGIAQWRPVQFLGVVESEWRPNGLGQVVTCSNARAYSDAIALASRRKGENTAVYWEQREEDLTVDVIENARTFVNSPLTTKLRGFRDKEIYSKAALHLIDVVAGLRPSLIDLPRHKAWTMVAEQRSGATHELLARLGFAA